LANVFLLKIIHEMESGKKEMENTGGEGDGMGFCPRPLLAGYSISVHRITKKNKHLYVSFGLL
jgi:hypothetical protein